MSLDIIVYLDKLSDELIPRIIHRLNNYEMVCEVHPNFSFDDCSNGFVPFKFQLTNSPFEVLKGKQLISGFEIYIDDFGLKSEKEKLLLEQSSNSKIVAIKEDDILFANESIDQKLKWCRKFVSFIWHSTDSFEPRFALLTSAILAELTNGVRCYPADDIWYDNEDIVENAWQEIKHSESTISPKDLIFHEFVDWS